MQQKTYSFSGKTTTCYFQTGFDLAGSFADPATTIFVTDENVYRHHAQKFQGRKLIVLQAGEQFKTQDTLNRVIAELIRHEADRKYLVVGVGGGVVTDLTGYAASVYMRGLRFGFVPVSILAMVDASIGGKNGIDVGPYKNLVGTIRQPEFLLYDTSFLQTLPHSEWVNGFAEIIKHACIKDAGLFAELGKHDLGYYQQNTVALDALIRRNVEIKSNVVQNDEFEQGERRLLNFGHTWGHAIETHLQIPHGHAVSIGMVTAATLSEHLNGFSETGRIKNLLVKYGLPLTAEANKQEVFKVMRMDKKKDQAAMNYVLLKNIGQAAVQKIAIDELEKLIVQ